MKKYFSISMLVIGSVIGAGFASGRELVSFFGNRISIWVAPACGLGYFIFNLIFMYIGSVINKNNVADANKAIMGQFHFVADFFLLFNSLVVLSGMLAGMDSLFSVFLPIAPIYSVITGILAAVVILKGNNGIIKVGNIIVPVIILVIFILSFANIDYPVVTKGEFRIYSLFIYVGMNLMLSGGFFVTLNNLDKKTIVFSSLISSVVLTLLMGLLIFALNGYADKFGDMPTLSLAMSSKFMTIITVIMIAVSIFTTMLTAMSTLQLWLNSYVRSKIFSVSLILIAGLIISNMGFTNVVEYLYPIIGVAGIIYMISCLVFAVRISKLPSLFVNSLFHKGNGKIHKRSKDT